MQCYGINFERAEKNIILTLIWNIAILNDVREKEIGKPKIFFSNVSQHVGFPNYW